jgi:hypothetical protein
MLISDERSSPTCPAAPWVRVSAPTSIREPLVARQVNRLARTSCSRRCRRWARGPSLPAAAHAARPHLLPAIRTPPPEFAAPIRLLWRLYHLAVVAAAAAAEPGGRRRHGLGDHAALIATHRLTRRPVTVVPNAADPPPDPSRLPRTRALVYMGTFMPYKNVETLVRAPRSCPTTSCTS